VIHLAATKSKDIASRLDTIPSIAGLNAPAGSG